VSTEIGLALGRGEPLGITGIEFLAEALVERIELVVG
jgi:hypothetical protein